MSTEPINPNAADEDKTGPETEEELDEQVEESMPASDPPANY
ncbi:hypothetical protein AB0K08_11690 [Citricoccus sp. NPDC055426]